MLKRLWLRITNKPAYGALLEMERLKALIVKKKKNHKKRSHLEKQFYDVRARYEILRRSKNV